MANMIHPKETARNCRLSSEIRKYKASVLDTEIYKQNHPSRGSFNNPTAFNAGFKYAENGNTLEELTNLYQIYTNLIENSNLNEDDCHTFLVELLSKFQNVIDFNINYPTQEKPSELLKKVVNKLRSVIDFNIGNPTEEEIRISKFIDGYNKFYRKAEIDFDLGYESARNGVNLDDIPTEKKETHFFEVGFHTYFTEMGFDYGMLGTDLNCIPIELQNNPFFMDGYNNGLIEKLMNKSTHRGRG